MTAAVAAANGVDVPPTIFYLFSFFGVYARRPPLRTASFGATLTFTSHTHTHSHSEPYLRPAAEWMKRDLHMKS